LGHNGKKWLVGLAVTLYQLAFERSLVKVVSLNFFRTMKEAKKSVAGLAVLWT
jgi:hypothetical protein